jgi:hypothetical protein
MVEDTDLFHGLRENRHSRGQDFSLAIRWARLCYFTKFRIAVLFLLNFDSKCCLFKKRSARVSWQLGLLGRHNHFAENTNLARPLL